MSNAQKTPFLRSQNIFAEKKVRDALQIAGKNLPCSVVSVDGWIVTVKFEVDAAPFTLPQVTVPVDSSEYDYLPIRQGDKGVVVSADTRLGNVSGLGGSPPKLGLIGNLSSLKFQPIGNKNFVAPDDPLVRMIQGPNGVLIKTMDDPVSSSIYLTKDDITATRGDNSKILMTEDDVTMFFGDDVYVRVDTDGVHIKGILFINDKQYLAHEHTGVQAGGSNSGGVHDP